MSRRSSLISLSSSASMRRSSSRLASHSTNVKAILDRSDCFTSRPPVTDPAKDQFYTACVTISPLNAFKKENRDGELSPWSVGGVSA